MISKPQSVLDLIGDTPLVELEGISRNPKVRIFAKLEWFNPGGSIKDRPARQMVLDAIEDGRLRSGMTILEATSGNTGRSLALIGSVLSIPVTLVIPEITSLPKRLDMKRLGAELVEVPGETTERALEEAYRMVEQEPGRYFFSNQYSNPSNIKAHYLTTGPEILSQCPEITHLVAAQRSFGTLGGTGRRIKEARPDVQVCAVVAQPGTQTLFGMKGDSHAMPLVDDTLIDAGKLISGYQAHEGIQIGLRSGYQLGPSAGGVLMAALNLAKGLREANIVCIFADGGGQYPDCRLYRRDTKSILSEDEANEEAFTRW